MTVQGKRRKRRTSNAADTAVSKSSANNSSSDASDPNSVPQQVGLLSNRTLGWSLVSSIGVWLAFPPVGLLLLAWVAPYGWLRLINARKLDGKKPYRMILLIGYVHWLMMTYWVTLPHPAAAVGWLFLAAYLAIYVLGFIALARGLVHRAGWSSVIAAPVAWVTMEVLRSYLFTGFALVPLSHSQVSLVPLMQISSFTGAYGVSFLVMLVAAALEKAIHPSVLTTTRVSRWLPLGISLGLLAGVLAYGWMAMGSPEEVQTTAKVAIVQGSLDTEFSGDPDAANARIRAAFKQYIRMSMQAAASDKIDLVVWPESMFRIGLFSYDPALKDQQFTNEYTFGEWEDIANGSARMEVSKIGTNCLVGTGTENFQDDVYEQYNTAALFSGNGELMDRYHKMHPVMFGEYIPLGNMVPWLYQLTPLGGGLSRGTEARSMEVASVGFVPNICFENTVPHLIRRHVNELQEAGKPVDVLVTLTNDGWFWGSALLDLHLACGIYRAVENGKPMLIAANTGFSAHIDRRGRVLQKGPRRAADVLFAEVGATDGGATFYTRFGDVFAAACCLISLVGIGIGWKSR